MAGSTKKLEQIAKDVATSTGLMDARSQTDTIRLWENYRDQALMWRALALSQIPATLLLVFFSTLLWATRSITLNVPARPLPGVYIANEIPDASFIEEASNFINLIASYQPYVARRQFTEAREMLQGPIIQTFDSDMMDVELKAVESTLRSQLFFVDPTLTEIQRPNNKQVVVSLTGERMKYIAGKELEPVLTKFSVTMTTIPRQTLNPYGIVVTNVAYENIERNKKK